ncbi:hypothetical protein MTO96_048766 [Rhipicephalus appendiculatus]
MDHEVIYERHHDCGASRWQRGTSSDVTVRRHRWRAVAAAADGGCCRGSAVSYAAGGPHTLSVSCLVRLSRPSSYRVVIEIDMGTSERRESEELALVVSEPPVVRDAPVRESRPQRAPRRRALVRRGTTGRPRPLAGTSGADPDFVKGGEGEPCDQLGLMNDEERVEGSTLR